MRVLTGGSSSSVGFAVGDLRLTGGNRCHRTASRRRWYRSSSLQQMLTASQAVRVEALLERWFRPRIDTGERMRTAPALGQLWFPDVDSVAELARPD